MILDQTVESVFFFIQNFSLCDFKINYFQVVIKFIMNLFGNITERTKLQIIIFIIILNIKNCVIYHLQIYVREHQEVTF